MTHFNLLNRSIAAIVGFIAFALYFATMAPTTSFWDCGEFIACSYSLGIPHPPGSPMFILLGRLFTMLPFGDIGWRVNLISVISTALSISVLHMIIVRLINQFRGLPKTGSDAFITLAGGAIGALTFMTTCTLWYSAVEAEVYALSTLLMALVLWLALLWADTHEDAYSIKHLVLIMYLVGIGAGVHLLNVLALPAVFLLIVFIDHRVLFRWNMLAISLVLAAVAYSAYLMILIRSGLDPYIDQNNPEVLKNFLSYLRRDQYGTESQMLTFLDRKAPFWSYQFSKLFLKYFGWNFIGKGATIGPDGYVVEILSLRGIYGIPCLMGFFGMIHHFRSDWRRASVIMMTFIMTGIALLIYLNQPDPQPRERDYIYVGCYFSFAVWIGIGIAGFLDQVMAAVRQSGRLWIPAAAGMTAVLLLAMPVTMGAFNYHENDRAGNYLPWDYSYNILDSCADDAILITNGDNDTFPLWYLQVVEGIRTDVDVVNLSLLNTSWYILQLKHQHGVPISLSDDEIRTTQYVYMEKPLTAVMEVDSLRVREYLKDQEGLRPIPPGNARMQFTVSPTLQGKALRMQDYCVLDIVRTNGFRRPLYFAITVGTEGMVGMDDYIRLDGMAYKLMPVSQKGRTNIQPEVAWKILNEKLKYRGINNPAIFQEPSTVGLIRNYRLVFMKTAIAFYEAQKNDMLVPVLDKHAEIMPLDMYPYQSVASAIQIGQLYAIGGRPDSLRAILTELEQQSGLDMQDLMMCAQSYQGLLNDRQSAARVYERMTAIEPKNPQPWSALIQILEMEQDYTRLTDVLERWLAMTPDDQQARLKLEQYKALAQQKKE